MTGPYFSLLKPACHLLTYLQLLQTFFQIPGTVQSPKCQTLFPLSMGCWLTWRAVSRQNSPVSAGAAHRSCRFTSMLPQPPFTITVATSISTHLQACVHTRGHGMPVAWCPLLANTGGVATSACTHLVLLHTSHGSSRNCPAVSRTNDYVLTKTAKIKAEGASSPGWLEPSFPPPPPPSCRPHVKPCHCTHKTVLYRLSCPPTPCLGTPQQKQDTCILLTSYDKSVEVEWGILTGLRIRTVRILARALILSQVVKITLPTMKQHVTAAALYWMPSAGSTTAHLLRGLQVWNMTVGNKAQGHRMAFHLPGQHRYHCR